LITLLGDFLTSETASLASLNTV